MADGLGDKMREAPGMAKIGVLALVPDHWHGIWMPRHQVMMRLGRHFEVVWLEPPLGWRSHWWFGGRGEETVQTHSARLPGFSLYEPGRWLPEVYRPRWLRNRLRRRRLQQARQMLLAKGCTQIVLYIWRPDFDWAVHMIDHDCVCYHIDDEYQFSAVDKPNEPQEVALIQAADLVIIHSRKLLEMKGDLNPNTIYVPNGVDYKAYVTPADEPPDLASIPHPRMGYIGVVKAQLDFSMLEAVARRRPDWSFVLVGPRGYLGDKAATLDRLAQLPNVHVMGNRQVHELPAYTQHMDVCMMCYDVEDFTNFHIYPLKMHEYLASGRPTVAAPIDAILPFGHVLAIARTAAEWEPALEAALAPGENAPDRRRARQAAAADHDWDLLVDKIAAGLHATLARNR